MYTVAITVAVVLVVFVVSVVLKSAGAAAAAVAAELVVSVVVSVAAANAATSITPSTVVMIGARRDNGHATSTVHAPVTDVTARRGRARGLGARGSNAGGRVRYHDDDITNNT